MTSLMGFVDSLMISHKGEEALAALGIGSSILLFLFSPTVAFIEIAQIFSAKYIRNSKKLQNILFHCFMILSVIVGICIVAASSFLIPILLGFFSESESIADQITAYTNIRIYEIVFTGIVFVSEGFWNGLGKPKYNLGTFGLMQLLNIVLNYLLVYGNFGFPELGIKGAAYSSVISVGIGSLVFLYIARYKYFDEYRPKVRKIVLRAIFTKLVPRMLGSLSIVMGYILLYFIISQLGVRATAVSNILIGFYVVMSTIIYAFGKSSTTFVGQAIGKKREMEATYWGWKTTIVSFIFFLFVGAILFIFSSQIAKLIFPDNLPAQQLFASLFALYATIIPLESIGITLSQALMGFGRVGIVTIILVVTEWLLALPGAWFVGITLDYGLRGIWLVYVAKWLIESCIFFVFFKKITTLKKTPKAYIYKATTIKHVAKTSNSLA